MTGMEWLETDRKLDPQVVSLFGVKETNHPAMGASVAFPYRRNGEVYAAKFRKLESKDWRSSQGVSRGLFNVDALKDHSGPAVLTEGEIDAISCVQAGFDRAVSLPDGWSEDGDKRKCLVDAEDDFRLAPYVIVAGDADKAGASLPKVMAAILIGHDVRYAKWPEGCKDANDVLVQFGEGELARCLNEAVRIDPPGGFITGISDLPPMPDRRVLRTGLDFLKFAVAFEVGAMSVGTGTPGSGKSTFTTFAAYHVARSEGVRVGFLSFETHPYRTRDHLARLHTGRVWDALAPQERKEVGLFMDRHFRIVHRTYDDGPGHNLGWLKDTIYTLAVRDGCKFIIVDPWNELEHMPEKGENMTAYINFALQQVRTWAETFDCHICVIAHPRKMETQGKPRSPTGYDIADSAAFANKPSLGFTVHLDQDQDGFEFVRLATWKVRDTQLYGLERGSTKLTFDKQAMAYASFQRGDE